MRCQVSFRGVCSPPEGALDLPSGPGSSVSHPSGALKGRRPRLGGGLCSLPQVATGFDVETVTAPPHGRGPLFASQRITSGTTSSGARRPRMGGGLCLLPQVASCVGFGKDSAPRGSRTRRAPGLFSATAQPPLRVRAQVSPPHASRLPQASGFFASERIANIQRPDIGAPLLAILPGPRAIQAPGLRLSAHGTRHVRAGRCVQGPERSPFDHRPSRLLRPASTSGGK